MQRWMRSLRQSTIRKRAHYFSWPSPIEGVVGQLQPVEFIRRLAELRAHITDRSVITALQLSRQIIGYRPPGNVFVIAQFAARPNGVFRRIFRPKRILRKLIFTEPYKSLPAHFD